MLKSELKRELINDFHSTIGSYADSEDPKEKWLQDFWKDSMFNNAICFFTIQELYDIIKDANTYKRMHSLKGR